MGVQRPSWSRSVACNQRTAVQQRAQQGSAAACTAGRHIGSPCRTWMWFSRPASSRALVQNCRAQQAASGVIKRQAVSLQHYARGAGARRGGVAARPAPEPAKPRCCAHACCATADECTARSSPWCWRQCRWQVHRTQAIPSCYHCRLTAASVLDCVLSVLSTLNWTCRCQRRQQGVSRQTQQRGAPRASSAQNASNLERAP